MPDVLDEPAIVLTDPVEPEALAAPDEPDGCPRCGNPKFGPVSGFGVQRRMVCFKCAHEWEI